ncbi:MAG: mechanosensitive ion channel [Acidobacteria bacterium]|nr:mechanosensitive ion channel [Acidobacteriota bacterium]
MDAFPNDLLNPNTLAGLIFFGAAFFVAATIAVLLIRRMTRRVAAHLTDVTAARFISALAQLLVYVVAFVLYAHVVPGLRAVGTALLTGVSVVSIVIGIAAQNTLGNLIAGLSLVLYRPFSVGDRVQLSSPKGVIAATVEEVSLGFTLLRDDEAQEVIVPNTVMIGTIMIRLNRSRR